MSYKLKIFREITWGHSQKGRYKARQPTGVMKRDDDKVRKNN